MSETVQTESVSYGVKRYGRIPTTVLMDSELSSDAARVFGMLMADTFEGNVATMGMRKIAQLLSVSPATIMRRIHELEARGHIKKAKCENGKRAFYMATSPVFGQKQRDGITTLVSCPKGHRRMATVGPEAMSA